MQKDTFDLVEEAIARAYPDCNNRGRGWWGATRIPNYGILREAIEKTILAALAEKDIEVDSFRDGIIDANEQIAALKDELAGYVILKEDYAQASALLVAAREQIAELKTEIEQMKEHTWCAYCGLEIHIDDEAATKISEHIMTCEKHPIHIALAENSRQAEEIERLKAELLTVHEILACPGEHRNGSLPEQPMTVRRLLDLIYVWHKNNERLDRYESDIRISEAALGLSGLYATKDKEIDDLKAEIFDYERCIKEVKLDSAAIHELSGRQAEEIVKLGEALDTIESIATDTTHDIQGIAQAALKSESEKYSIHTYSAIMETYLIYGPEKEEKE